MKIDRENLLRCLSSVSAGLASREIIEQSACYVFRDGKVITFNDEVAAVHDCPLTGFEAAIPAKPFTELLRKLAEETVNIIWKDGYLEVSGKNKKAKIRGEAEIALPFDTVEDADSWAALEPDFAEAVGIVESCASNDDSSFVLTCVHIMPDYIEACDNFQVCRYPIKTGLTEECLVRHAALRSLAGLGIIEIGASQSWLHFRNSDGLVLSCRRWVEDYQELGGLLEWSGDKVTLPPGLDEAVSKAEVFSAEDAENNNVCLKLNSGKMSIIGEGQFGKYQERKTVAYDGPDMEFLIAPKLLAAIGKRATDCELMPGRLKIDAGKFVYVASLGKAQ